MDKTYMDMHLTTDRYLQGRLTAEEIEAFEERLTWDQDLLNELELADRLREGMKATFADSGFNLGTRETVWGNVATLLDRPVYAAAASFLLAVVLSAGVIMSVDQPEFSPTDGAAVTTIVPLMSTRGIGDNVVTLHPDKATVLLLSAVPEFDNYRVTVRGPSNDRDSVREFQPVPVTYPESLAISFDAGNLIAGNYVVTVDGMVSGQRYEHVHDIEFRAEFVAP